MVYILAGDEDYFIDRIEKKIINTYLEEEQKDFNLRQFYGLDTTVEEVLAVSRKYPMMSQYNIVVVREAQALARAEELKNLIDFPVSTTILVLCYKGKMPDARSKFVAAVKKDYIFVECKSLYERQLPGYIEMIAQEYGLRLNGAAVQLLIENIGSNLQRIEKEVEKLSLVPDASKRVLIDEDITRYTTVSKVYNNFELLRALAMKNEADAMKITYNLIAEQKKVPLPTTLSMLFNYFSMLLCVLRSPNKSEEGIMKVLDLRNTYQTTNYKLGLRNYSQGKVRLIVAYLRRCDARSKGLYGGNPDPGAILRDLMFFILH